MKVVGVVVVCLALVLGFWTYTQAVANDIVICVKNNGTVRVIGSQYKRDDCKANETLLTWNISGPQGPKGDTGEQGPAGVQGKKGEKGESGGPATHGAGNIAFMFNGDTSYLLKTDGTVWLSNTTSGWGGPLFTQITSAVATLPVSVSDIVAWEYYSLVDKDGNYWYFEYHTGDNVWHNFGPLP